MSLKEILFDLFGIGFALFLLVHLVLIWVYGTVLIYENHYWILIVETISVSGIIILGLDRLNQDRKNYK